MNKLPPVHKHFGDVEVGDCTGFSFVNGCGGVVQYSGIAVLKFSLVVFVWHSSGASFIYVFWVENGVACLGQ